MNTTYIALLGSLIACTGRAMDEEYSHIQSYADADKTIEDILRYRFNDKTAIPEQFRAIYIADKKIQKIGKSNLTEDEMLGEIEKVLKPYESMPAVSEEIREMYQWDGIKAWQGKLSSGRVLSFGVNESGSRVALTNADDIVVVEEKSRGVWADLQRYRVSFGIQDMVLSGQQFRMMGDAIEANAFNTAIKMIIIERDGFTVKYQPTFREIAAHFVKQRQAKSSAICGALGDDEAIRKKQKLSTEETN